MLNIAEAREKVCIIIYDFLSKLYMRGVNRDRDLQFAMAILCKAKGQCNVLTHVEEELSVYGIKDNDINQVVVKILTICGDKRDEILPACADVIIDKYTNGPWGEYLQPRVLSELVLTMMKEKGCKVVYNPFAGLASYALADFIEKYYGQEINYATANIAKMRLELNNVDYSNYVNVDSIKEWDDHGADCIVSTPPFGGTLDRNDPLSAGATSFEEFVIRKYLDSNVTYAFLVVSRSFCYSSGRYINIKREIIESNTLDMVIDIPANLFSSTSIATSLIILSKKRKKNDSVTFIDGSEYIDKEKKLLDITAILNTISTIENPNKAVVTCDDIINSDYLFSPQRYTLKLEIPEGYIKVKLRDIAVISSTGSRDTNNGQRGEYIKEPTLLLSLSIPHADLLTASEENPVFIPSGRYVKCLLNESIIDRDYFIYKMGHLDRSILNAFMTGTIIKSFSLRSLSNMEFCIPDSIQSQKNALIEAKQAELEARIRESGLEKLLEQKKKEFIDIVRTRKHDMRPYLRELDSAEILMRHYLSKKDEMTDYSKKMTIVLDLFHNALAKLSSLIDIFSEEDNFGTPELFNIDKYFYDMEINHDEEISGFAIEYYCDDNALLSSGLPVHKAFSKGFSLLNDMISFKAEIVKGDDVIPLMIDIAPTDFERMVRNIIENAKTHGFTDPNRKDYGFFIDLSVNPDNNMFQMDFSNNGNPLPKGMNKERYGMLGEKAGITGGTGRGGYVVKSVVEHYNGDYDVFMDGENTVIRVLLPISKQYGK